MADEIADAELADDRLRDQLEAERHVSVGLLRSELDDVESLERGATVREEAAMSRVDELENTLLDTLERLESAVERERAAMVAIDEQAAAHGAERDAARAEVEALQTRVERSCRQPESTVRRPRRSTTLDCCAY